METSVTPVHSIGTERINDKETVNDLLGCREVKPKCLQREILMGSQFTLWDAEKTQELEVQIPENVEGRQELETRRSFQYWSKKHFVPCEPTLTALLGVSSVPP